MYRNFLFENGCAFSAVLVIHRAMLVTGCLILDEDMAAEAKSSIKYPVSCPPDSPLRSALAKLGGR